MTGSDRTSHAEQHLGDRLAALVDGELGHDTRERVLAHLATCCKCKAEADAQRRLKSVFAESAPPPPSEGLLARLQGLPGGDGRRDDPFGGPGGPDSFGGFGGGLPGGRNSVSYLPGGRDHRARAVTDVVGAVRQSGFRIHDTGRFPGAAAVQRGNAQRGRRFAFAAAGAVSLAALALGGALPLEAAVETASKRSEGAGPATTPIRATPAGNTEVFAGPAGEDTARSGGARSTGGRSAPVPTATTHPQPISLMLPAGAVISPLIAWPAAGRGGASADMFLSEKPASPAPTVHAAPSAPREAAGNRAAPLVGASGVPVSPPLGGR
ncbi:MULTISPECIES: anti-sigma factor [Streptomyces]|uniref:Zf-HC2 domain-containing protein n=1 Tax=Streptomyces lycii TaxID=2654337 RepID=A0ABQ7FPU7_9ACTN|nr:MULTISPECIES: zf-HC2 domain-containing protein [Streptomyces]KAF4410414.1 zf-HC2 domain-containing protein [Streptomyces lycii]PGH52406.1 hypothetical protein CRI70_01545 [Streptomyces sp. Ru87]